MHTHPASITQQQQQQQQQAVGILKTGVRNERVGRQEGKTLGCVLLCVNQQKKGIDTRRGGEKKNIEACVWMEHKKNHLRQCDAR